MTIIDATFETPGTAIVKVPESAIAAVPAYGETLARLAAKRQELSSIQAVLAAPTFRIQTQEQAQWCEQWLQIAAANEKTINAERDSNVRPFNKIVDEVNANFMPLVKGWADVKKRLGQAAAAYQQSLVVERQRALQAAAAAHLVGAHAEAQQALTVANTAAAAAPVAGLSAKPVWKAKIVQPDRVPRAWCDPSEARINAVAKATPGNATPPPIDGVEFYLETQTTFRGK
jgi:hypothetical protein